MEKLHINCVQELTINQMLLDYVIITLSEIKTTKGAFTYYIITGGRGGGGVKNLIKRDSIISEWS